MASILFKWFLMAGLVFNSPAANNHPIYVSVVEIEHNAKEKMLEVSCKIFTDDFEKALRSTYKTHVDLLDSKYKTAMDKLVNDYVQKHFKISADNKSVALKYVGYEQTDEGITCYFEGDNITTVKNITVVDNILYEFQAQQMGLIHCTVNGDTKNYKLNNPEEKASFNF